MACNNKPLVVAGDAGLAQQVLALEGPWGAVVLKEVVVRGQLLLPLPGLRVSPLSQPVEDLDCAIPSQHLLGQGESPCCRTGWASG